MIESHPGDTFISHEPNDINPLDGAEDAEQASGDINALKGIYDNYMLRLRSLDLM
jgi:hypothetical protein